MVKLKFSVNEVKDLVKAWLAVSIVFLLAYFGWSFENFMRSFLIIALIVGSAFILHELSHKFFAVKYGYYAEFKSFDKMLLVSIVLGFFGFIFLAPGAVFIFGNVTNDKNGKISLAGPVTNLILALIFLIIGGPIGLSGFRINSWLAFFNMLPFFGLDGSKVFEWNKMVFFIVIVISALMAFGM